MVEIHRSAAQTAESKLLAIELQNFQSIDDLARVEFSPITLMFGPNSAGKSAIFDALELIECLWVPTKFQQERAKEMLERWARRPGEDSAKTILSIEFQQRANGVDPWSIWNDDENWKCLKPRTEYPSFTNFDDLIPDYKDKTYKIRLGVSIGWLQKDLYPYKRGPYVDRIEILVNNKKIISFEKECPVDDFVDLLLKDTCNLARYFTIHDIWTFGNGEIKNIQVVKNKSANEVPDQDISKKQYVICGFLTPLEFDIRTFDDNSHFSKKFIGIADNASDIIFYFGTLLGKILRNSTPIVRAERRVPYESEALYFLDPRVVPWDNERLNESSPASLMKQILQRRDPHLSKIAEAAHAAQISKTLQEIGRNEEELNRDFLLYLDLSDSIISKINQYLSEDLFTEKLYQIRCNSTIILPVEYLDESVRQNWIFGQPATASLYLTDGEGRKLELYDVGSGIPFVLPVLCALAVGGVVRVQQPELHLHPALQASVADIFLREVKSSNVLNAVNTHIIETHSEHLILRILRRIRETGKGEKDMQDLALAPEDVAVYYFNPKVNGGTFIKRIRIGNDGEFIDRWPRGFFAERSAELFDE